MTVEDAIIDLIKKNACLSVPVSEASHLYADLGFDSLSFIAVLAEIEDAYTITFDITELEACLQAGRLIITVKNKIKERDGSHDQAFAGNQGKFG